MARYHHVILIVEDDDQVLETIQTVLSSLGYAVIPATSAEAALEILEFYRGIDLLITDIVLPGAIDGWELARRAKQRRPELRVLYTSGFDGKAALERGPGYGPLLPKPWRPPELIKLVHRTLHQRRRSVAPA